MFYSEDSSVVLLAAKADRDTAPTPPPPPPLLPPPPWNSIHACLTCHTAQSQSGYDNCNYYYFVSFSIVQCTSVLRDWRAHSEHRRRGASIGYEAPLYPYLHPHPPPPTPSPPPPPPPPPTHTHPLSPVRYTGGSHGSCG